MPLAARLRSEAKGLFDHRSLTGNYLMNEQRVLDDIERLGPWFHNIHLSAAVQNLSSSSFW
jgi:hypothetical protein